MANFLTEKVLFMCNQGGVIRCIDSGNKSVTHDGAELLTQGATLKGLQRHLSNFGSRTGQTAKL